MNLNLSVHDLFLLGFLVIFAVAVDIVLGNLRASYDGVHNSSAGYKGLLKKGIILVITLAMMLLLYVVTEFAEAKILVTTIAVTYPTVVLPLGYHEIQSILANVQMTYPDINIAEGINKFFNVKSEKENKVRKLNNMKSDME